MTYLDSFLRHSEKKIKSEIKKLTPISYNRFYWWKSFKQKKESLSSKYSLIEKIENGDYDFSSYFWQAQYAILKGIEKIKDITDYDLQIEKTSIDLERYRKLMNDFEKEEQTRLLELKLKFTKEFEISFEQIEQEMLNYNGTLKDFYYFILKTYNQKSKRTTK